MRKAGIFVLILSIAFVFAAVRGVSASDDSLYSGMIDQRIARCELKGKLAGSSGENLRKYGQKAIDQADFYRENKAELIDLMIHENIGTNPHKVSYYLINAYRSTGEARHLAVR